MRSTLLFASLALVGCATSHTATGSAQAPVHAASPAQASASDALPHFIEDDYAAALAQARAQNKPLFVEAWAPW